MSTLNSRLQLSILNRKKGKNFIEKGFTLVELMIVVIVVGILSAVALPQFIGAKDKAEINASIGEQFALAKECSSALIGELPLPSGCLTASGGTFTSIAAKPNGAGAKCGPSSTVASGKACAIAVSSAGAISYTTP